MKRSTSGFTIVELIIVIVVIAILAVVTVVAYNGVQNRNHVAAVHSDLRAVYTFVEAYKLENRTYPHDTVAAADANSTSNTLRAQLSAIPMEVSQGSYSPNSSNGLFVSKTDGTVWAYLVIPKNGTAYYVSNTVSAPTPYTQAYPRCFPGCSARDVAGFFGMTYAETSFNYVYTTGFGFRFWN